MASTEINLNGGESIYHVLNELHVTHRCCRHDNILDCTSRAQNQKILVSFESGKALSSFSLFQKGCKEKYVSYIIRGTLAALDCIHVSGNRVHGNINLNTVFLDNDCRVKLGFPTRVSNPDLENNEKKEVTQSGKDIDISMVAELACKLYRGESGKKKLFPGFHRTLPVVLQDFVKFCIDSQGTTTIRKLMNHALFKQFNEFDIYQEELKKLLE